ncbi:McrC family protein, partial [Vibrio sp. D173a]|nr:McrC family protein [Vibrio sp. D173a]
KVLKEYLKGTNPEYSLHTQVKGKHLAKYQNRGRFALRPDLMIRLGELNKVVMDTKWKLLDVDAFNADISQSDIYQMFAYAKKYLNQPDEGNDVILIYPYQDNFDKPLLEPFDLDDGHKLWVVPFSINDSMQSKLLMPDGQSNDWFVNVL